MVPERCRQRTTEALDEVSYTLRWWLFGLVPMAVQGVAIMIGGLDRGAAESPKDAVGTGLYLCIHAAEGYAITPLVQRRVVRLPPVVTILAQLIMYTVAGLLGLALATPLAAAALALVRILILNEQPLSSSGPHRGGGGRRKAPDWQGEAGVPKSSSPAA